MPSHRFLISISQSLTHRGQDVETVLSEVKRQRASVTCEEDAILVEACTLLALHHLQQTTELGAGTMGAPSLPSTATLIGALRYCQLLVQVLDMLPGHPVNHSPEMPVLMPVNTLHELVAYLDRLHQMIYQFIEGIRAAESQARSAPVLLVVLTSDMLSLHYLNELSILREAVRECSEAKEVCPGVLSWLIRYLDSLGDNLDIMEHYWPEWTLR